MWQAVLTPDEGAMSSKQETHSLCYSGLGLGCGWGWERGVAYTVDKEDVESEEDGLIRL